jgi:hypothetical protein
VTKDMILSLITLPGITLGLYYAPSIAMLIRAWISG